MALWIELRFKCEEAYRGDHVENLIRRFFDYARWC